jgi:predicted enzyme related to lactoylglutathione lyase
MKIKIASIFVDDQDKALRFYTEKLGFIKKEYERLKQLGVEFTTEPTKTGPVTIAVFNDTCGNLIQLVEEISS